jgi:signal transduction histidine kinase
MALTSVVAFFCWEQNLIQAEKRHLITTLSVITDRGESDDDNQPLLSPTVLHRLQKQLDASCLLLSFPDLTISVPEKCEETHPQSPSLQKHLRQMAPLKTAGSITINSGPALPFFRHQQIITTIPVYHQGIQGRLAVITSLQAVTEQMQRGKRIVFVYILVNVIVLTTIGLFRLVRIVLHPIERLVTLTNEYQDIYQQQGIGSLLSDQGCSEFSQLSLAMQQMVQRINEDRLTLQETVGSLKKANQQLQTAQQQMVLTEKMAAIGRLAAGLAHEIGNPIGIIQGYVELLRQSGLSPEDQQQFASRSLQELERINRLLYQLLNFSRASDDNVGSTDIHPLIVELVEMLQAQKNLADLRFSMTLAARNHLVNVKSERLHQVFLNCLLNAVDAVQERYGRANCTRPADQGNCGAIHIATATITSDQGEALIQITIADNGVGIKDADRGNLFDPFFTTKDPGKGTGLGLSVSHALIEGMGGQIRIVGQEGQGATVYIFLPLQKEENMSQPTGIITP